MLVRRDQRASPESVNTTFRARSSWDSLGKSDLDLDEVDEGMIGAVNPELHWVQESGFRVWGLRLRI